MIAQTRTFDRREPRGYCTISTATFRNIPLHVAVPGACSLTGHVMAERIKSVDYAARRMKFVERAPDFLLDEAPSILDACLYEPS